MSEFLRMADEDLKSVIAYLGSDRFPVEATLILADYELKAIYRQDHCLWVLKRFMPKSRQAVGPVFMWCRLHKWWQRLRRHSQPN